MSKQTRVNALPSPLFVVDFHWFFSVWPLRAWATRQEELVLRVKPHPFFLSSNAQLANIPSSMRPPAFLVSIEE